MSSESLKKQRLARVNPTASAPMEEKQILKHITDFLTDRYQMTIATSGEHPWIATVYYSLDSNLNIYFLSNPETLHCQQIALNPQVAVSICDSPQNPSVQKKGVQLFGVAEQVSGVQKIKHAISLWRETLGVTSEAYTYEGMMKKAISGRMYRVQPKKIKFFNEELWEEGCEPIVTLK